MLLRNTCLRNIRHLAYKFLEESIKMDKYYFGGGFKTVRGYNIILNHIPTTVYVVWQTFLPLPDKLAPCIFCDGTYQTAITSSFAACCNHFLVAPTALQLRYKYTSTSFFAKTKNKKTTQQHKTLSYWPEVHRLVVWPKLASTPVGDARDLRSQQVKKTTYFSVPWHPNDIEWLTPNRV